MTPRSLQRIARAVRRADRVLGRLRRRRTVLVEARTPMNLAVLRPVFAPLLQDHRLSLRFTGADLRELQPAFDEAGVADRVITRRQAARMRVDLYMNADPWDAAVLWRVDRQINFFHGVAGKYNLDCPVELPLGLRRYDRIAFPNRGRRDSYVAAGLVPDERAVVLGYPKVDALVTDPGSSRAHAAALGLDPARPAVIFAPTFSPASALNRAGEAIIETLLAAGCHVIVKLHDRSFDPDQRYSGGIDWRARLARFAGPGFVLADSGDSTRYVLASDLMVTDHSSIGFEFCALDRPVIVYDAPDLIAAARINPQKVQLLRSAARVVADMLSLQAAVAEALAAPGAQSEERRRVAGEVFYRPGGATGRALRLVYEMLQLPPAPALAALVRQEGAPAA